MAIFVVYFLAYVSRRFILFLLRPNQLFLFPISKQDSRNIFGKHLSVFALSTMRYSSSFFWHQKELHTCRFYSYLKQFFRNHFLLQKPNQRSNNTVDEGFSPTEFSIDISYLPYSIFHIYLIRYFIFISSSDPKSRNQSIGIK